MIGHEIHQDPHLVRVGCVDKCSEVVLGAAVFSEFEVIDDGIAIVTLRCGVDRRQPQCVDTEIMPVGYSGRNTAKSVRANVEWYNPISDRIRDRSADLLKTRLVGANCRMR